MAENTELIIFDWDDVFTVGSTEAYQQCYHEAVMAVGVEMKPEEELTRMRLNWGATHDVILAGLLKDHPELLPRAEQIYLEHLNGDTFVDRLSVIPEAPMLLERLAGKYTLALATGIHPDVLREKVMDKYDVSPDSFSQIVTAYDVRPDQAKPSPYIAERIMGVNKKRPHQTVVVGDAPNDIKMGKNAKTATVAVLTGHLSRPQAEVLMPDFIIENVTKVEEVLDSG